MMNKIYTLILFVVCLCFSSCKDEFVELLPVAPNSETFFNNEEEYEDALIGAYDMLQTTINNVIIATTASDDIIAGGDPGTFDQPTMQRVDKMIHDPSDNNQIRDVWNLMYAGLNRANYILEFKDKTDFDGKDEVIAQAYFLRAYFAFELAKFYGDIPLFVDNRDGKDRIANVRILSGDQYTIGRVGSQSKVYDLIAEDLLEAIPNLPINRAENEVYKITQGAAQALLGRVYIFNKKFAEAAPFLQDVIDGNQYELLTGSAYSTLFEAAGENSKESVFEIQYTGVLGNNWDCLHCNAGNYAPQTNGPRSMSSGKYRAGWGLNIVAPPLYDAFEAGDARRDVSILRLTTGQFGHTPSREHSGLYNRKYLVIDSEFTISSDPVSYQNNFRVIRYADVLLMAAEAYAETDQTAEAQTYLNQVRARAFGDNSHDYTAAEGDLLQAIYDERRLELCGEAIRFFDIVRTGKAKETFDAYNTYVEADGLPNTDDRTVSFTVGKNEIFPIPLVELNLANGLERWGQNPNY